MRLPIPDSRALDAASPPAPERRVRHRARGITPGNPMRSCSIGIEDEILCCRLSIERRNRREHELFQQPYDTTADRNNATFAALSLANDYPPFDQIDILNAQAPYLCRTQSRVQEKSNAEFVSDWALRGDQTCLLILGEHVLNLRRVCLRVPNAGHRITL